jgi:hypothetical protein
MLARGADIDRERRPTGQQTLGGCLRAEVLGEGDQVGARIESA